MFNVRIPWKTSGANHTGQHELLFIRDKNCYRNCLGFFLKQMNLSPSRCLDFKGQPGVWVLWCHKMDQHVIIFGFVTKNTSVIAPLWNIHTKYKYRIPRSGEVARFHQNFSLLLRYWFKTEGSASNLPCCSLSRFSTVWNSPFDYCHLNRLYCTWQHLDFPSHHVCFCRARLLAWELCSWSSLAHMSLTTPNNVSALLSLLLLPLMTVSSTLNLVKKHLNSALILSFRRPPASMLKECFLP